MRKRLHFLLTLLFALPIGMLAQGTTWQSATDLPLGQVKSGQLSENRNEDWWTFTVTADGAANIICTPGSGLRINDVRLYFFDEGRSNYHERSDNAFHTDPGWYEGTLTIPNLAPGTYLFKVNRGEGSGSYNIKVEFTADPYANSKTPDAWNDADVLPLNTPKQGHLGYGYVASSEDNEDWWTFTVDADGEASFNIKPSSTLRINDLRLYFFDEGQSNCHERSDNAFYINPGWYEGTLTTPNLAPGTYLLKVNRGEGCGGYTLTYTFNANVYANDNDVNDWTKPAKLTLGKSVQGHLGYGYAASSEDHTDWWEFEVTRDGAVTFAITPGEGLRVNDLRLYYYDADKANFHERSDKTFYVNPGWYQGSFTTPNLAPGTYLLKVNRGEGCGGYELNCTLEPQAFKNDLEPNNKWYDGLANNYLARGQEKQGHLGYGYAASSEDHTDWYRIKVPADGVVRLIYTPTAENSHLRVNDVRLHWIEPDNSNCHERSDNTFYINPGWDAGELRIPNMAPGEYLVKVNRGEDYGAYSLKYVFEQNPLPNDGQPEDWQQPTKLPEGKTLSGHLGYGYTASSEDNTDWYEVTMAKDGTLTINIQPGENLRINDVRLHYYDTDKSNYHQRSKSNFYINPGRDAGSLVVENVEAGDYLIKVNRGEGCGNYRISFNADLADVEPLEPMEDEEVEPDPGTDPQPGGDAIDEFTLWYTLDIGGTVGYKLSEKPQVRLLGAETTVTSSRGVMTFETQKIWKFTLNAPGDPTAIEETVAPVQPEYNANVNVSGDALVFSGCRPGEPVYIYTAGGRVVSQNRIGSDGSLELPLNALRPGLYIVKAGSTNIKFLKK